MIINPIGNSYNSPSVSGAYSGYVFGAPNSVSESIPGRVNESQKPDIKLPGIENEKDSVKGTTECQTCKNRKYVDGSNESVSYKSPTHISPAAAPGAVRAHEGEHVSNAYSKAAQGNGRVISANVSIKMAICPECGRCYVAGGLTTTKIAYKNEKNPYIANLKASQGAGIKGMNFDKKS